MKLERYVLLDNEIIYDQESIKEDELIYRIIKRIENGDTENLCRKFVKSSNNILDLVEVGDLVECTYHKEATTGEKWVETPIHSIITISDKYFKRYINHLHGLSIEKTHKFITAIYKKQPNGDYKRYEVESNK